MCLFQHLTHLQGIVRGVVLNQNYLCGFLLSQSGVDSGYNIPLGIVNGDDDRYIHIQLVTGSGLIAIIGLVFPGFSARQILHQWLFAGQVSIKVIGRAADSRVQ